MEDFDYNSHSSDDDVSFETDSYMSYSDGEEPVYYDDPFIPVNYEFDFTPINEVNDETNRQVAHPIFDPIGDFLESIENSDIVNDHIRYGIACGEMCRSV